MINNRYLEIDSSYRDRRSWPNPAEFEIPVWKNTNSDRLAAADPVSNSASKKLWISNRFVQNAVVEDNDGVPIITTPISITITVLNITDRNGAPGDQFIVTVSAPPGALQPFDGYYNGVVGVRSGVTSENRRVLSYTYLGKDQGEFIFLPSFPTLLQPGDTIVITDPTNLSDDLFPTFFVPNGDNNANAYVNCVLYNDTRGAYRNILTFDAVTKMLSIDTFQTTEVTTKSGPITDWLIIDTYSIRQTAPLLSGELGLDFYSTPSSVYGYYASRNSFALPKDTVGDFTGDFIELRQKLPQIYIMGTLAAGGIKTVYFSYFPDMPDFYKSYTIRMSSGPSSGLTSTITSFDPVTRKAILNPGFSRGTSIGDTFFLYKKNGEARRIVRYVNYVGISVGGTDTTILFDSNASDINGYYNNLYVRFNFKNGTPGYTIPGDALAIVSDYKVTKVNGIITTRTATLALKSGLLLPFVAGDKYEFTSGVIESEIPYPFYIQRFNILSFTKDNLSPFLNISGSTNISQQENTRYEIELINIIVPNEVLRVGYGTRLTFYPYLYVELSNSNASNQGNYFIYSNNPNSTKAVFRVPIDDSATAVNSGFLKLDGDGMVQNIAFRFRDNLKFSLRLPSGEILKTAPDENYSPDFPNPLAQISALFYMKKA